MDFMTSSMGPDLQFEKLLKMCPDSLVSRQDEKTDPPQKADENSKRSLLI